MVYTDVTWLELWGGWILAVLFAVMSITFERLFRSQKRYSDYWYNEYQDELARADIANDKAFSLEATIARLTVRKRGKDGRFEKSKG